MPGQQVVGGEEMDKGRDQEKPCLQTFPFAPPFLALAVKALLGHIGADTVHGKTLEKVLGTSGAEAAMINIKY